jgi:hypothetical protein
MPEEIVARILRLPGYGVYAWEADEARNTPTATSEPCCAVAAAIGITSTCCSRSRRPPPAAASAGPHEPRPSYTFW